MQESQKRTRFWVHIGFSGVLLIVILIFNALNNDAVIKQLFTAAGYTYGPLLGLFTFGMTTNLQIREVLDLGTFSWGAKLPPFLRKVNLVILVCLFAPCLSFDKNSKRKCEYRHNIRVQEKNSNNEYKDTFKPFIGAIFNYDETNKGRNGDFYTAQFLFNKNDKENKDNYKIGLVNGTQGKFGSNENFGKNAEFSCPVNSALYKIETLHEENKINKNASIKGIKLHCRDINNGDKVKILNNKNDLVDSIYFGVEPNASNNKYYYSQVECVFNKDSNSPGFISNITTVFSNNNINSIKVNA